MLKPTSPESQDISPSLPSHKNDHDKEQTSSSAETASRTYPHATRDETLPATMPHKAPALQLPVSRVAVSHRKLLDEQAHASSPSESEKADANMAYGAETDNKLPRPHRRTESGRRKRAGSPQAVKLVVGNLEPNQPDIALQARQTLLESEPEPEAEDGVGVASGLDVGTESGGDGAPSLESLLKEWTTLYEPR
jgi:hypothetical protein